MSNQTNNTSTSEETDEWMEKLKTTEWWRIQNGIKK
jgi:hypothetical protein